MEILILSGIAVILILIILLFSGLIGPKWLRNIMRRFNTFLNKDAAIFFPLDPYKSLPEGVQNLLPIQQRLRNFLLVNSILLIIIVIGILISIVLTIGYRP